MLQMEAFLRDDVFPSWFANALTKALSLLTSQFQLVKVDNTHVQVPASANAGAAVIAIGGQWRWIEATAGPIAHPGGAAGTYPVFVTARNNNITNSPDPFTDDTNYAFNLVVLAPGRTPTIVAGVVDVYRQVGTVTWDGAKITRVTQTAPVSPLHSASHAIGGADPLSPADIGAVALADPTTAQTGDLIASAATSRSGCVLADGTAYSRTDPSYAPLFAKLGTRFGAGDGSTTFNVPDCRDTVLIGASVTRPLATRGGENTHVLATGEMPTHTHTDLGHGHAASVLTGNADIQAADVLGAGWSAPSTNDAGAAEQTASSSAPFLSGWFPHASGWSYNRLVHSHVDGGHGHGMTLNTGFANLQAVGGGGAHNNMQQFVAVNVFVKL